MVMQFEHKNYEKIRQSYVKEVDSQVILYRHKITGARLLFLLNDDDNKVFSVSFKTPPEDDFGIPHIMEHSVLCGSKKYPCKEPFVELIKSSLNTFLNAMTFSDKTMYPVASCNKEDFNNLMDVYLDAVFNPLISEETFFQEGWHHTIDDKNNLDYQGVVFNEMKGVYSQAESYLELAKNRVFYKGTQYANESGGYPPAIPDLTYEDYLKFYDKHYHPANSYIFIYGDVDAPYYLDFLDKKYLSKYSAPSYSLPTIRTIKPWEKPLEQNCSYPISMEENEEKKTYLLWSFLLENCTQSLHLMSFSILHHILLGNSSAPLRKALMESGLCENTLNYGFDEYNFQTSFNFGVKGANESDKDKISKIIFSTLENLVKDKIDKESVLAAINYYEFKLREADFGSYPKGLVYNIGLMLGWLHGENPENFLEYETNLQHLKDCVEKEDYFENLITQYFINNQSYLVTSCVPDKSFNHKLNSYYEKKLLTFKEKMNSSELEALRERVKSLEAHQLAEDSPEILAKIPTLKKSSLERNIKYSLPQKDNIEGCPTYYTLTHTSNIYYFTFAFNTGCLDLEQLKYLPFFTSFFLNLGSENYSPEKLHQKIDLLTGGVEINHTVQTSIDGNLQIYTLLEIKVMKDDLEKFKGLLNEVVYKIDFSNKKKMLELLKAKRTNLLHYLNTAGESVAIAKVEKQISLQGKINEHIGSFNLYNLCNSLVKNFDTLYGELVESLLKIKEAIITKDSLNISITCSENMKSEGQTFLQNFVKILPRKKFIQQEYNFEDNKKETLAIATENTVQYVAKGISTSKFPNLLQGEFSFINQLLRTSYLWDNVRVKGGAYGCFVRYSPSQQTYVLCSYRDPNLKETLDIYDLVGSYLKNLQFDEESFTKLLIGTVGMIDKPLTAKQQGHRDLLLSLQGFTNDILQKRRDELFAFNSKKLVNFVELFDELARNGVVVVHGNNDKINKNTTLFTNVIKVESKM